MITAADPGITFGPHKMERDSKGTFCYHCQAGWPCVAVEAYRTGRAEVEAERDEASAEVSRLRTVLVATDEIAHQMRPVVEAATALLQLEKTRNDQVEHSSIWLSALKDRQSSLLGATRRYVRQATDGA